MRQEPDPSSSTLAVMAPLRYVDILLKNFRYCGKQKGGRLRLGRKKFRMSNISGITALFCLPDLSGVVEFRLGPDSVGNTGAA